MDDEMNDGGRLIFIDEGGAYERPR
jgi:hypothetical protein